MRKNTLSGLETNQLLELLIQNPPDDLQIMDLSNNKIDDGCMEKFAYFLQHVGVKTLNLSNNEITKKGIKNFSEIFLEAPKLRCLDIRNNFFIDKESFSYLKAIIQKSRLVEIQYHNFLAQFKNEAKEIEKMLILNVIKNGPEGSFSLKEQ